MRGLNSVRGQDGNLSSLDGWLNGIGHAQLRSRRRLVDRSENRFGCRAKRIPAIFQPFAGRVQTPGAIRVGDADTRRHLSGEIHVDLVIRSTIRSRTDITSTLPKLEAKGQDNVLLLHFRLASPEEPRLAEVISEAVATFADLLSLDALRKADECAHVRAWLKRAAIA